ncbi:CHAT domain-containing protein [Sphingomonas sp. R86521]|uniref:CHAT domain-containing protein n=1 Tax=Sphingomonas sp. R86521 TaxID=3093860 RepID=UPI0036D418C8
MSKKKTARIDLIVHRVGEDMIHSARTDFNVAHAVNTTKAVLSSLGVARGVVESTLIDTRSMSNADLEGFGKDLAAALLSGEVTGLYSKTASGCRIQLGICVDDPLLKTVPWEFMFWPDLQTAPHPHRCVARLVPGTDIKPLPPLKLTSGGRVLLAVAAPTNQPNVDWIETEADMKRIFAANTNDTDLKSIDFRLVEAATADALRKAVQNFDPHIVHFIGHGRPDGLWFLKHRSNAGSVVPTSMLRNVLASDSTRLVVLSACDTANVGTDIAPLIPLAERLVRGGIPAVVANQMPMSLRSVATFCAALYSDLLQEGDVDWAVNNGRIAVGVAYANVNAATVEWGVPVLYRRPGCSQLFTAG